MRTNPYDAPTTDVHSGFDWRSLWKRICLASLCLAIVFLGLGKLLAASAKSSPPAARFLILDGSLALGELVGWTMVGVGGIGWILSRRKPPIEGLDRQSELGA